MSQTIDTFKAGMMVEVTQQISRRTDALTSQMRGEVVKFEQKKTGSWYAHSKDDQLWLDRLTLRKEDGEMIVLHLDSNTHVQIIQ